MITFEYIEQEYNKALEHAYGLIPSRNWSSLPTSLVLTDSPRRLGIADESTGEVSINTRYQNTTAYTSLRNTIFHELAHFCVGTHNNHNKVFKRVLSRFTAHFEVDKNELQQLIKQVDFKWHVVAHLENGDVHEIYLRIEVSVSLEVTENRNISLKTKSLKIKSKISQKNHRFIISKTILILLRFKIVSFYIPDLSAFMYIPKTRFGMEAL